MKFYITFGQIHTHSINGITIDKDCIVEIECDNYDAARERAFDLFGKKFSFIRVTDDIQRSLHFFPRGIIKL
jgi:hypothetical protein